MTIPWDELRFLLAIARQRSMAGAARALSVNESTVARHLKALEAALDVRLFERLPSGYQLTDSGRRVLPIAERIEREIAALELDVLGAEHELSGPVRVTVPEYLAAFTVARLAGFRDGYPEITPELIISNMPLDMRRRESDVAFRVVRTPPPSLFGRRLCDYVYAVYGASDYLAAHDPMRPETLAWLGIHGGDPRPCWVDDVVPGARLAASIDQLTPTLEAIRRGLGVGKLPCVLGDVEPGLRRLCEPIRSEHGVWLLTHEQLKTTRRVRVFMDHLAAAVVADKDLFEGRRPRRERDGDAGSPGDSRRADGGTSEARR